MLSIRDHEDAQRGSPDFPLSFYAIDERHARYEMPYHWHEEVEFIRVRRGRFALSIDGEAILLCENDAAFIASGRLHGGVPDACVYECAVLDLRLLLHGSDPCRRLIGAVMSRRADVTPFIAAGDGVACACMNALFAALREKPTGWELTTLGCLWRFFGDVFARGAYTARGDAALPEGSRVLRLKRVFELIENQIDDPPSLSVLSAAAGMTPKYFCRFFKAATHRTPMDYVAYCRVETACSLMAATDRNVTEIALDMGYTDINYFIRCFRKYKGMTPRKYMLEVRGGSGAGKTPPPT